MIIKKKSGFIIDFYVNEVVLLIYMWMNKLWVMQVRPNFGNPNIFIYINFNPNSNNYAIDLFLLQIENVQNCFLFWTKNWIKTFTFGLFNIYAHTDKFMKKIIDLISLFFYITRQYNIIHTWTCAYELNCKLTLGRKSPN